MKENQEIVTLKERLIELRKEGKVLLAILYGSYARGTQHGRSDIDLALYLKPSGSRNDLDVVDRILMAVDRDISILRLDDEDESPFVVREALKGIHLVEPERETLYAVSHRILHECEEISFRREIKSWTG